MALHSQKKFPWVKEINSKLLINSGEDEYPLETLQILSWNCKREVENITENKSMKRAKKLISVINGYLYHFHLKIDGKKDSLCFQLCIRLLSYLVDLCIILSSNDPTSEWIELAVKNLILYTNGCSNFQYDALLQANCVKKRYSNVCVPIVKCVLKKLPENVKDSKDYLKIILMCRLLKVFSSDMTSKTDILSRASRIKAPSSALSWLQSTQLEGFENLKKSSKHLVKFLMCSHFQPSFFRNLRKELISDPFPEMCDQNANTSHTASNILLEDIAFIDKNPDPLHVIDSYQQNVVRPKKRVTFSLPDESITEENNDIGTHTEGMSMINPRGDIFCEISKKKKRKRSCLKASGLNTECDEPSFSIVKNDNGISESFNYDDSIEKEKAQTKKLMKKKGQGANILENSQSLKNDELSESSRVQELMNALSTAKDDENELAMVETIIPNKEKKKKKRKQKSNKEQSDLTENDQTSTVKNEELNEFLSFLTECDDASEIFHNREQKLVNDENELEMVETIASDKGKKEKKRKKSNKESDSTGKDLAEGELNELLSFIFEHGDASEIFSNNEQKLVNALSTMNDENELITAETIVSDKGKKKKKRNQKSNKEQGDLTGIGQTSTVEVDECVNKSEIRNNEQKLKADGKQSEMTKKENTKTLDTEPTPSLSKRNKKLKLLEPEHREEVQDASKQDSKTEIQILPSINKKKRKRGNSETTAVVEQEPSKLVKPIEIKDYTEKSDGLSSKTKKNRKKLKHNEQQNTVSEPLCTSESEKVNEDQIIEVKDIQSTTEFDDELQTQLLALSDTKRKRKRKNKTNKQQVAENRTIESSLNEANQDHLVNTNVVNMLEAEATSPSGKNRTDTNEIALKSIGSFKVEQNDKLESKDNQVIKDNALEFEPVKPSSVGKIIKPDPINQQERSRSPTFILENQVIKDKSTEFNEMEGQDELNSKICQELNVAESGKERKLSIEKNTIPKFSETTDENHVESVEAGKTTIAESYDIQDVDKTSDVAVQQQEKLMDISIISPVNKTIIEENKPSIDAADISDVNQYNISETKHVPSSANKQNSTEWMSHKSQPSDVCAPLENFESIEIDGTHEKLVTPGSKRTKRKSVKLHEHQLFSQDVYTSRVLHDDDPSSDNVEVDMTSEDKSKISSLELTNTEHEDKCSKVDIPTSNKEKKCSSSKSIEIETKEQLIKSNQKICDGSPPKEASLTSKREMKRKSVKICETRLLNQSDDVQSEEQPSSSCIVEEGVPNEGELKYDDKNMHDVSLYDNVNECSINSDAELTSGKKKKHSIEKQTSEDEVFIRNTTLNDVIDEQLLNESLSLQGDQQNEVVDKHSDTKGDNLQSTDVKEIVQENEIFDDENPHMQATEVDNQSETKKQPFKLESYEMPGKQVFSGSKRKLKRKSVKSQYQEDDILQGEDEPSTSRTMETDMPKGQLEHDNIDLVPPHSKTTSSRKKDSLEKQTELKSIDEDPDLKLDEVINEQSITKPSSLQSNEQVEFIGKHSDLVGNTKCNCRSLEGKEIGGQDTSNNEKQVAVEDEQVQVDNSQTSIKTESSVKNNLLNDTDIELNDENQIKNDIPEPLSFTDENKARAVLNDKIPIKDELVNYSADIMECVNQVASNDVPKQTDEPIHVDNDPSDGTMELKSLNQADKSLCMSEHNIPCKTIDDLITCVVAIQSKSAPNDTNTSPDGDDNLNTATSTPESPDAALSEKIDACPKESPTRKSLRLSSKRTSKVTKESEIYISTRSGRKQLQKSSEPSVLNIESAEDSTVTELIASNEENSDENLRNEMKTDSQNTMHSPSKQIEDPTAVDNYVHKNSFDSINPEDDLHPDQTSDKENTAEVISDLQHETETLKTESGMKSVSGSSDPGSSTDSTHLRTPGKVEQTSIPVAVIQKTILDNEFSIFKKLETTPKKSEKTGKRFALMSSNSSHNMDTFMEVRRSSRLSKKIDEDAKKSDDYFKLEDGKNLDFSDLKPQHDTGVVQEIKSDMPGEAFLVNESEFRSSKVSDIEDEFSTSSNEKGSPHKKKRILRSRPCRKAPVGSKDNVDIGLGVHLRNLYLNSPKHLPEPLKSEDSSSEISTSQNAASLTQDVTDDSINNFLSNAQDSSPPKVEEEDGNNPVSKVDDCDGEDSDSSFGSYSSMSLSQEYISKSKKCLKEAASKRKTCSQDSENESSKRYNLRSRKTLIVPPKLTL